MESVVESSGCEAGFFTGLLLVSISVLGLLTLLLGGVNGGGFTLVLGLFTLELGGVNGAELTLVAG